MTIEGRVIRGVVCTLPQFIKSFGRIRDPRLQSEIRDTLRGLLLLNIDQPPAKLKLHQLKNSKVPSFVDPSRRINAWTIHVTANDAYKASFTYEDGIAYFRLIDEHDVVDKNP